MRAQVAVAALTVLVCSEFATAQTEMPSLQIVIAPIRQDAIACGMNESSIASAAETTLRSSGIQTAVNDNNKEQYVVPARNPILVVTSNVLHPSGNCIANILVEIKEAMYFESEHKGGFTPKAGNIWTVLCSSATLMTVSPEKAAEHFHRTVEANVRGCLRQLDY